jgi:tetratricopeptide (TPR) repeat protein
MNFAVGKHPTTTVADKERWWTVRSARGFEPVRQPAARGAHGPHRRRHDQTAVRMLVVLFMLVLLFGLALPGLRAAEGETMADRSLRRIVERQRDLLAEAAKQGDKLDAEAFRSQAQSIAHDYELLLRNNPTFATAYAAYGYWLGKVGMAKEAAAMLLRANQLDPNMPMVKNQLGNHLAEDGKPLQAAPYFIAAIKLAPNEPLYHYQLGTLLVEARADFLKSGEWSRPTLDQAMHHAFQRAAELAPDRFEFAYRYAESFYDLEKPDWDAALKAWSALEDKAPTAIERQTMRLHAANICLKLGKRDHAKALLATVDEAGLQGQKQKLIAQLAETPKKD